MKEENNDMTTENVFLARQPILGCDSRIIAYELLYRSNRADAFEAIPRRPVTISLIRSVLGVMGLSAVSGGHTVFINLDTSDLIDEVTEVLPADKVVLEILESVPPTEDLLMRCRELKSAGYRLALDDFIYSPSWEPFLELVDFVKLDVLALDAHSLQEQTARYRARGLAVIAEKVEDKSNSGALKTWGSMHSRGFILPGRRF